MSSYRDVSGLYTEAIRTYEALPFGAPERRRLHRDLTRIEKMLLDAGAPGKRKGLRPPQFSRLTLPPLPRLSDVIEVIPESEWGDYLADPDCPKFRPFVWDILDQNAAGSCASEGITGCIMGCREFMGLPQLKLNPWFVYHTVSGGVDMGSTLQDNIAFTLDKGVCTQEIWGREKGWRAKPSDQAYENAQRHKLLEIVSINSKAEHGTCLLLGIPVYCGYDSHAIFGVDLIDSSRFRFANSWDESWGDGGFGTLSYAEVIWAFGAYGVLSVTKPSDE